MRLIVRIVAVAAVAVAAVLAALVWYYRPTVERTYKSSSVRVAAAADLRFALDEVVRRFESVHDVDVQTSYGSSGTFYAQLLNQAPFDVFLSADIDYPRQLAARGLTLPDSEFTYAVGRQMEYYDAPAIRSIVRAAAADDYRWSSTILAVVKSVPFQMRRARS